MITSQNINQTSSINLAKNMLKALDKYGLVWNYFEEAKDKERRLRSLFTPLRVKYPSEWPDFDFDQKNKENNPLLYLKDFYGVDRTILKNKSEDIYKIIKRVCNKQRHNDLFYKELTFWKLHDGEKMGKLVSSLLDEISMVNKRRDGVSILPASFVTKFMHFCRPDVFPIKDSYVEACWEAVAKEKIVGDVDWNSKKKDKLDYKWIVDFYKNLWNLTLMQFHDKIEEKVESIKTNFGLRSFTVLDGIDKFFWQAYQVALRNELFT